VCSYQPAEHGRILTSMPTAPIDREALVRRHSIRIRSADGTLPVTVGNGEFAFTADFTGLQTFPELYASHIPLCTMSQWGWHSFPVPQALRSQRLRPTELDTFGRRVGYFIDPTGQEALFNHLRQNPHRLHLGRLGLRMIRADGSGATVEDVSEICQQLDLWTGLLVSRFRFDGHPVEVHTCCAGEHDAIAVRVMSPLIHEGRIRIVLAFPYGSPDIDAADWDKPTSHAAGCR
jgi:protein-glucosylgalactosylhydroxylysine glucosidase